MNHFIDHIKIQNFKSIKKCGISDCKRINLFIGRPNVGKSNIIEALSLFSVPFLKEGSSRKLSNLIRIENETELFYKGNWADEIAIESNLGYCNIMFNPKDALSITLSDREVNYIATVDDRLLVKAFYPINPYQSNIKRYTYKADVVYKKGHFKYLIPPFGQNLLSVIENYPKLKADVIDFFKDYDLEIAFDKSSQTIKILERNREGIFLIPYNSIADTLQRIIFYKAAIESNDKSILLFEEPEAHSFPPYMTQLTQEMIYKKDNQFFIATHSPYILNDLLENAQDELAVFNVDYKDKQTHVRQLSRNELYEVFQHGVDLFTNNESYL